jgi:PadR family transcriptional regulator PadR
MRRTTSLVALAVAIMGDPSGRHWGYDLSRNAGLRSGVLYPMLQRLLENGWLQDGWEPVEEAQAEKRPARRYYVLTEFGAKELGALAASAPQPVRVGKLGLA